MSKPTVATLGKKKLCNPPVLAAVQSAEAMIEAKMLTDEEIHGLIDCDERFTKRYNEILKGAVDRLAGGG